MMSAVIRMEELAAHPEYLSIADIDGVRLDLRYACANNFVGRNLYGDAAPALLHRRAAEQLSQAARALSLQRPGYRLRVFDALRPGRVQRVLWDIVRTRRSAFMSPIRRAARFTASAWRWT